MRKYRIQLDQDKFTPLTTADHYGSQVEWDNGALFLRDEQGRLSLILAPGSWVTCQDLGETE